MLNELQQPPPVRLEPCLLRWLFQETTESTSVPSATQSIIISLVLGLALLNV